MSSQVIDVNPHNMHPKDFIYSLLIDLYLLDLDDQQLTERLYMFHGDRSRFLNEIKSILTLKDSKWWIEACVVKCPLGWTFSILKEDDWLCLYAMNMTVLYLKCFEYELRIPFTELQKKVFHHFRLTPIMIMLNS